MQNLKKKEFWKSLWNKALSFLSPPLCLSCRAHTQNWGEFCPTCWKELIFVSPPFCKQCGRPFEYKIEEGMLCPACIQNSPHYDCVRSVFIYNDVSKRIILNLKHHDATHLAKYMSHYMTTHHFGLLDKCDIIAPIPLHQMRLFTRKFNQSALILNHFPQAKAAHIYDLLIRKRNTPIQANLDARRRIKNVKSAFSINKKYIDNLKDKTVLLIDDVFTTGATVNECAKLLKRKGAKEVCVLSFARAHFEAYKDVL
jgi:ComF family protein